MIIKRYNSVRPSFMFLLNEIPEGKIKAVEVGTAKGENAAKMFDYCDRLELTGVDIEKTKEMDIVLDKYKERIKFLHNSSVNAAKSFPDNYFDYVYIDGAHDEENVYKDVVAWYPKLRMGGIMAGHDWWFKGVQDGVAKFFNDTYWQYLFGLQSYFPKAHNIESHHAEFMDWWFIKHSEDYILELKQEVK